MTNTKKILFIKISNSTFILKDEEILNQHFEVTSYFYGTEKGFKAGFSLIKQFFYLLLNTWKYDLIYIWFADYHSFLPTLFAKLFRKKSVIIVGGNDAVSIPEIEYGIFYKKDLRSRVASWSYTLTNLILPVHKSLIEGVNDYVTKKGLNIGVKAFVKGLKTKFVELPTGYDHEKWFLKNHISKEQMVVTVAGIHNMKTYRGKGIDLFIEVAKKTPDATFVIIGLTSEMANFIKKNKPDNVDLQTYIPNDKLADYIAKAKVYCQFSLTEGLPNSLCEAMLCECIPVGSSVNGIPDGIGNTGYILKERDVVQATILVKKALRDDAKAGKKARQHIIDNYSHDKREEALCKLLANELS